MDPRFSALAQTLVEYSVGVQPGDNVFLDVSEVPEAVVLAVMRAIYAAGGQVFLQTQKSRWGRELLLQGSKPYWDTRAARDLELMKAMQCYIAIRGSENIFESSDVPAAQMQRAMESMKPVLDYRVEHTRWVILRWPTASMAQQAALSTAAFEELFFKVCTLDYSKMAAGAQALKALMDKTDQVHIQGPGETDLRFSIKNIPSIVCAGKHNLPDGEVFTAPVKDSVEGVIAYNTPTLYQGKGFDNIRLRFKNGKIVEATAQNGSKEALDAILDNDPGARYVGEFAIAFNPYIQNPMRDILFDEKIAGSFHFTPGQAYEDADNGNRSQVHWDLVAIQRPDYGGGSIFFDGTLIRKDGQFIPQSLQGLNF